MIEPRSRNAHDPRIRNFRHDTMLLRYINLAPKRSLRRSFTARTPKQTDDVFSSVVPNTGSTARDHLANERTFLAWARTGLTFVGLGVAIDSLVRVSNSLEAEVEDRQDATAGGVKTEKWRAHAPATGLVLTGAAVLSFSTVRYYRIQNCLMQGTFPLNRVGLGAVIASTSLLTLASLMMTFSDEIIDTSTFVTLPNYNTGRKVSTVGANSKNNNED
jgi:uncharacterized membrane protein YidH (DUF202 family)